MARIRTFLDAGIFLTAHLSESEKAGRALAIFEDPGREWVSSNLLSLEVLPQALYHRQKEEIALYEACFGCIRSWVEVDAKLVGRAEVEAARYGLHAMDALHIASALTAGAEEFVTTELPTKPLYRVTALRVVYLHRV